jgi:prolyl-tRNA synthetase
VDVILDDRDQRPGVMFAEWELIGIPVRVTVGDRGLKEGQVEILLRQEQEPSLIPLGEAAQICIAKLTAL